MFEKDIQYLKNFYNHKRGEQSVLIAKEKSLLEDLLTLNLKQLEECGIILQKMSTHHREVSRKKLEDLGTLALQYSLGPEYEMIIEISESRKKPIAEVYIYNKNTKFKTNPMEQNGGGVIDILSAAMRVIVMQSLVSPVIDGPIIMDEPFKMVSKEFTPAITEFMKRISDEFDRQFIIVTHNDFITSSCDQILTVSMNQSGVSIVEEQKEE